MVRYSSQASALATIQPHEVLKLLKVERASFTHTELVHTSLLITEMF